MDCTIEELYKQFVSKGESILADIHEDCLSPSEVNEELLMKILHDNKDTEYGRKYGFENIHSVREYCQKVPLSDYDDYKPFIHRMIENGENNLITAYDVIHYATTSGSVGVQKIIPMTNESIIGDSLFARTIALAQHYLQSSGRELPVGKCLNMLETESYMVENGMQCSSASGFVSRRYRNLFSVLMTSPEPVLIPTGGMNLTYMKARFALEDPGLVFILSMFLSNIVDMMNYIRSNWEMIVNDIENGTLCGEVCNEVQRSALMPYMKKNPERAAELRAEFSKGLDEPIIPRIWKNMTWICSISSGEFSIYINKFKQYAGEDVAIDYLFYGASEGVFAVSTEMNDSHYTPLLRSCFFEFLPIDAPTGSTDTLLLDQLEEGKEYELIITNLSGFYRYRMRDVIRIELRKENCPLFSFGYRKGQLGNIAGEKMTVELMNEVIRRFGNEVGCFFNDYAVYIDKACDVSRYVILIEPSKTIAVDTDGAYAEIMEHLLCEVNPEYGILAGRGNLGRPVVLIQQQQTHALWREMHIFKGVSANQIKPVRVLDHSVKQSFFFSLIEEGQTLPIMKTFENKKQ